MRNLRLFPESTANSVSHQEISRWHNIPDLRRFAQNNLSKTASQEGYSDASWINNRGIIAGGSCVNNCASWQGYSFYHNAFTAYGTFSGYASEAYCINDSGEIVGQSDTDSLDEFGNFVSVAFMVKNGVVSRLGELPGYANSAAFVINNSSVAAGRCYSADPEDPTSPMRAVLFESGNVIDIGTLGGNTSTAFSINDKGQVVGRAKTATGESHAFLYQDGIMKDIGTLGGNYSTGRDINNAGVIVGGSRFSPGDDQHAFVYSNGSMMDLGTFGGPFSEAFSINESGWVAGYATTALGEDHAFLYRDGIMHDLGTLGGSYSVAFCVNEKGEVVGVSERADGYSHGFLYKDGGMTDLGIIF